MSNDVKVMKFNISDSSVTSLGFIGSSRGLKRFNDNLFCSKSLGSVVASGIYNRNSSIVKNSSVSGGDLRESLAVVSLADSGNVGTCGGSAKEGGKTHKSLKSIKCK